MQLLRPPLVLRATIGPIGISPRRAWRRGLRVSLWRTERNRTTGVIGSSGGGAFDSSRGSVLRSSATYRLAARTRVRSTACLARQWHRGGSGGRRAYTAEALRLRLPRGRGSAGWSRAPADPTTRGIVAPPDDKFDSFGETVNAVRAAAALFGADAKDSQMGGALLLRFPRPK